MNFLNLILDASSVLLYLIIFLFAGKFFYGHLSAKFTNKFVKNYLELFFGFVVVLSFYAIIQTSGKTVLSLFLIVLLIQFFIFKIKPDFLFFKKISKADFFSVLLMFGFFILFFGLQLFRHQYFNADFVRLGWGDFGYYSDLAESLNITGVERGESWNSYFSSETISYSSTPSPYHFFDLWTQALFLNFSLNKGVFIFIYIFTPFVSTLVSGAFLMLGRFLISDNTKIKTFFLITISFLMPFFMGKLPFLAGGWEDNVLYYPRNYMFYILLILFWVFYKKGFKSEAVYFLGLAGFINILYLPTVSIVLVLFAAYQLIILKEKKTYYLNSVFVGFLVSLLTFLFYFVIFKGGETNSIDIGGIGDIKQYFFKGLRYYFRLQLARWWLFYLPLTLFAGYFIIKKIKEKDYSFLKKEILIVSTFLLLVSLIFASYVPHLESGTFNSIVLNATLAVLTFGSAIFLVNNFTPIINKLLLGFIVFQLVYSLIFVTFDIGKGPYIGRTKYSKTFLTELSKFEVDNKIGAFVANKDEIKNSPFEAKSNLSWFTAIFDVADNGYHQVSLTAFIHQDSIPFQSIKSQAMYAPMFKYGNNKIKNDAIYNRDSIDLQFIADYKIEYLIIQPSVKIPHYLESKTKTVIKDELSGVQVITLK